MESLLGKDRPSRPVDRPKVDASSRSRNGISLRTHAVTPVRTPPSVPAASLPTASTDPPSRTMFLAAPPKKPEEARSTELNVVSSAIVLEQAMQGAPPAPFDYSARGAPPPVRNDEPKKVGRARGWFVSALLFVMPALFAFASIMFGYPTMASSWKYVAKVSTTLWHIAV